MRLLFREYEPRPLLPDEHVATDAAALQRLKFDVRQSLTDGQFWIYPGSVVGVVRLPSSRVAEVRPKVPLRNLLWMLAYANDVKVDFEKEPVDLNEFADVIEYIARYFTELVEAQIDLGLYRNYVEEEDNLTAVRGKILTADDLRQNLVLRQRIYCRYTSFSWDIPENQVIRQVVRMLGGWGFSQGLSRRLAALDIQLDEISRSHFSASDVDRFVYNRQSESYRPIHRLCRLFLEASSLSEEVGDAAFDGFLLDMNALFERFVTTAVRQRLTAPRSLRDQFSMHMDVDARVTMRPDLVVYDESTPTHVADCKYKRLRDEGTFLHHDLYQMLAYATVLRLPSGTLIYPRHLNEVDSTITVRNSGVNLREITVALDGSLDELNAEMDRLTTVISR